MSQWTERLKTMKNKLLDLIDFDKVDLLLEGFNKATGFVTAILDLDGNVLSKSGWRQICTEFHRINSETSKKCTISDTLLAGKMEAGEKYHFYKCLNGLIDVAVPIVINGEHIANLFSGQFFFEEPDRNFFIKQAKGFGFNEEKYLEALEKVPVISKEKVLDAMDFLLNMTQLISEMTYQKLEQIDLNKIYRESEEKFSIMFRKAPFPAALSSLPDLKLVEVNEQFEKYWGYSSAEVIGKTSSELGLHPDNNERARLSAIFQERGFIHGIESKMKSKSGELKDVLINSDIVIINHKQFILSTAQNITDRKQAEETLRQSDKKFSVLFEKAAVPMALTKMPEGVFADVNEAFQSNFGYHREELIGKTSVEIGMARPDERDETSAKLEKYNELRENEKHLFTKTGEARIGLVNINKTIINGQDYVITSIHDITERKQAEEKQAQTYELLTNLARLVPGVIYQYRLYPDGSSTFPYSSPGMYSIYEVTPEQVREDATPVFGRLHPDDADRVSNLIFESARTLEEFQCEFRVILPEQGLRWRWSQAHPERTEDGGTLWHGIISDISERKQAENALRESERHLRYSQQIAHIGSWQLDLATNQVMWTEELYHMYGFDPALPPPPYTEHMKLFTPASWDVLSTSLTRTRETGIPYELELETVKEDNSNGWMWVRGEVSKDSDGNTIGLWGAAQDITDRKRTENTLRESEERFRRSIISAPIPIMIHAEDGQVITINTPWTQLTGYEHSDIPMIADWTRKAYGDQMDLVREDIDHLYTLDGPKEEGEYTITTNSGEERIWDFSSAPIGQLPDGRRLVISMAMDVTERKNVEAERKKFFLLAESSSEFIGMCDLDMNPLYVNPAGQRLVGLPDMAAACQVKVQDYFFPEDQRFITEEFFPRVLREGHGDVEIRLRHFLSGEPIWMYYYLFRVQDSKGTLVGWATVSRDISERKRMLEELEQLNSELERKVRLRTAQLEASNKELEAFSYSVSHDLRAPLRHINGYVNLINNQFQKSLPEKAGHYLNEVTASAKQMGILIDDLLQFSKTGRQELRLADMDMNIIIQEAIEVLKTDTENRKISWTVATLPQVIGDYSLLKQVWMNLLDNAVKYTRYKDEAEIEIGFTREPDHWVFFVRDNGSGFDMQYAHKLFGVFQRLHSSAQFEGTGIGLANVQQIVNKHGGRVWATAQTDKGATFNFTIPYDTHR